MTVRFEVVTFDIWATLIHRQDEVAITAVTWAEALRQNGIDIDDDAVPLALDRTWSRVEAAWHSNTPWPVDGAAKVFIDELDIDVEDELALVDQLASISGVDHVVPLVDAIETLKELASMGVGIGFISDVGLTPSVRLRSLLSEVGLLQGVSHFSFSDESGNWKPSVTLFDDAAVALGATSPSRCLHVGDSLRTDVAGARSAGWSTVRYSGVRDDSSSFPEADHVIQRLGSLPNIVLYGNEHAEVLTQ